MLKNQLKKLTVAALVAAMIVPAGVSNADKQQVTRISGKDRIQTSVEISKSAYTTSENVVLASGFNFADALSAGQLASALDAPLLLSSQDKLDSQTKNEINRLKAKKVFVVGGDNAISKTGIDTTLKSEKIDVTRLEGQDRYSTSQKVMEKTKEIINPEYLLIASGKNFPDALAATGFFVNHKSVMVLSDGLTYPQSNLQEIAIGGKNQLPLKGFKGKRVSGKDRYETALEIAKLSFDKNNNAILASGQVFADSLSAVSLTKKHNAPIVLTQSDSLTENAKKYLNGKNVFIVGGEKTVVKDILTRKKPAVKKEDKNLHTKTGQYYSSLISSKLSKSKSREYNQAYDVKIKGDYLIVSGNMKYFKEINSFSGGKPIGDSASHTFKITNKTVFKLHSGLAPTAYKKPNEFIDYYHKISNTGLGLSITVENGVATEVLIAS
ncbi:MAG: cell wall-binding repeat-containing protein [Finegoldia magna]|uniref:cell wall-binding repeat-containing protein n=1 Tax=Finegoldia magna TaxID=1260 RepID=UPI0026F2F097|nr:cell wall-binding repeat-containing protein [Finegoldia magna]MBS5776739.1 cell wall-binding repeat-containing protein [Finegoldia magna]MDU2575887.1 cell wall-binding repeat-containing protein [Finegoldia magna]MDU7478321.1 cell wall-binding repeat-containing protein [Finegoldia magna]